MSRWATTATVRPPPWPVPASDDVSDLVQLRVESRFPDESAVVGGPFFFLERRRLDLRQLDEQAFVLLVHRQDVFERRGDPGVGRDRRQLGLVLGEHLEFLGGDTRDRAPEGAQLTVRKIGTLRVEKLRKRHNRPMLPEERCRVRPPPFRTSGWAVRETGPVRPLYPLSGPNAEFAPFRSRGDAGVRTRPLAVGAGSPALLDRRLRRVSARWAGDAALAQPAGARGCAGFRRSGPGRHRGDDRRRANCRNLRRDSPASAERFAPAADHHEAVGVAGGVGDVRNRHESGPHRGSSTSWK